jgi:hypothetical protein
MSISKQSKGRSRGRTKAGELPDPKEFAKRNFHPHPRLDPIEDYWTMPWHFSEVLKAWLEIRREDFADLLEDFSEQPVKPEPGGWEVFENSCHRQWLLDRINEVQHAAADFKAKLLAEAIEVNRRQLRAEAQVAS